MFQRNPEHMRKLQAAARRYWNSLTLEGRKALTKKANEARRGSHNTEEQKRKAGVKISLVEKGVPKPMSEVTKEIHREINRLPENRRRVSEFFKGKPLKEGHRAKISLSKTIPMEDRTDPLFGAKLEAWAIEVKQRDNFTCKKCGKTKQELLSEESPHQQVRKFSRIHAHHILPKYMFLDSAYDISNGVTLCYRCHAALEATLAAKIISFACNNGFFDQTNHQIHKEFIGGDFEKDI